MPDEPRPSLDYTPSGPLGGFGPCFLDVVTRLRRLEYALSRCPTIAAELAAFMRESDVAAVEALQIATVERQSGPS